MAKLFLILLVLYVQQPKNRISVAFQCFNSFTLLHNFFKFFWLSMLTKTHIEKCMKAFNMILKRSEFYPDPNKPTCFPLFFLRFVQLLFFNNLLRFSQQWKNMGVKFGRLHQQPFELKLINANRALLEVQVIMFSSAADHSTESFFVYFAIVPIYLYIILMQTSFDQY